MTGTIVESVKFPKRRIAITVEHETCGDEEFHKMVKSAINEYLKKDKDGGLMEFRASNGVFLEITNANVIDTPPYEAETMETLSYKLFSKEVTA